MKAVAEIQESEPASGSSVRRTKVRYTYDDQNQLKTETRYTYSSNTDTTGSPVTYSYSYDTAGNILSVTSNSATLTYTYGDANWRDLLTAVGGTTISYDGSGNPTNWYNGTTSYSGLTWENGRQLVQITTGGKTSKYTYDADGIRSTKDVNGTKHEYRTLNGKVVWEKIGEGTSAKIMVFSYDAQGRPFGFKFSKNNGTSYTNYFYALNQQGDVVKIFRPVTVKDADGNVTGYTEKTYATYTYDAWGKLISILDSGGNNLINKQTTSTALANLNPLRYRGYYYDTETGFYYLQSRYYDPAVRRFINADVYASTGQGFIGMNMFAYCNNTPVIFTDNSGKTAEEVGGWWSSVMWWLCAIDGALPIGDVIYWVGCGICCLFIVDKANNAAATTPDFSKSENKEGESSKAEPEIPDVTYPGDDPTKAPDGTVWRGSGPQGSQQGNYYNPNTGESWHPDLDHPEPIGPHWDYKDPSGIWWRIGPNNIPMLK